MSGMIELLEPLSRIPGVRLTALVTEDGVPVAVPGVELSRGDVDMSEEDAPAPQSVESVEGLAAGAVGWLDEVTAAAGTLSWNSPDRVILRAARGTLLMLRTSGAVLVAVLDAGLDPEELKLPMDGVAARIQRVLRGMGGDRSRIDDPRRAREPRPPLPAPPWATTGRVEASQETGQLGMKGSSGGTHNSAGM